MKVTELVKNKNILISGGAGDLSRSLVEALGKSNFLVLVDIKEEPDWVKKYSSNYLYLHGDICNGPQLEKILYERQKVKNIRINGIVNTPAYNDFMPFSESKYSDIKKIVETKLIGYANVIRACASLMTDNSSIVNIASVHAHATYEKYVMYSAANAGVIAMSRALAIEFKRKCRVNSVTPGGFLTEKYKEFNSDWKSKLENKQILKTEEVVNVIVFLLSDDSMAINATEIVTDVGVSALRAGSSNW